MGKGFKILFDIRRRVAGLDVKKLDIMRDDFYESMYSIAKLPPTGGDDTAKILLETKTLSLFDNFKTPQELHYLAKKIKWETHEEIELVFLICQSHICSQATALMLFWRAQPLNFTKYKLDSKMTYFSNTWAAIIFEIIQYIMRRFTDDGYQHFGISYDPKAYVLLEDAKNAELLDTHKTAKWQIPPIMTRTV